MNTKLISGTAIAALVLGGAVSAQSVASQTGLNAQQAIEIALAEVAGEVIEVEKETEDGETVFEIEILTAEGVEYEIEVSAVSGEILEVEAEDDDDDDKDDDDDDDDKMDG